MKKVVLAILTVSLICYLSACQKGSETEETSSVKWVLYEKAMEKAREGGRPAMILFTRQGCPSCAQLEEGTLHDPGVVSILNRSFLPVRVDADRNAKLVQHFRVFVYPTIWFYVEGDLVGPVIGYAPPDHFKRILRYISTGAYKTKDFRDFEG